MVVRATLTVAPFLRNRAHFYGTGFRSRVRFAEQRDHHAAGTIQLALGRRSRSALVLVFGLGPIIRAARRRERLERRRWRLGRHSGRSRHVPGWKFWAPANRCGSAGRLGDRRKVCGRSGEGRGWRGHRHGRCPHWLGCWWMGRDRWASFGRQRGLGRGWNAHRGGRRHRFGHGRYGGLGRNGHGWVRRNDGFRGCAGRQSGVGRFRNYLHRRNQALRRRMHRGDGVLRRLQRKHSRLQQRSVRRSAPR
jgi:hypothetical protein